MGIKQHQKTPSKIMIKTKEKSRILAVKEGYGVAVDLGATNLKVAIGLRNGKILAKKSEPTAAVSGSKALTRKIIDRINGFLIELNLPYERLMGIGVGAIGPLDRKKGGIVKSPNIPHYNFISIVQPLTNEFNVSVHLLNDCVAGVVGEKLFGLGASEENLAYITISTGIGGGVFVDGHLLLGKDGNAHEIGHMVIDYQGRLLCGCGKRGHWEAYCSGRNVPNYTRIIFEDEGWKSFSKSLLNSYTEGDPNKITTKDIYYGAQQNEKTCLKIVEEVGRLNAIGFANVVNVYDPSLITVGGAVALNNRNLVITPINKYLNRYIINNPPIIKITPLDENIVLYGALAAAFNLVNSQT
ncbi:MAG: ROK family protein [Candidatus Bathyarchaeota archaeon]|nr:MAG: ROK family protein [Candidatus Bathyarchaeota archaeon]